MNQKKDWKKEAELYKQAFEHDEEVIRKLLDQIADLSKPEEEEDEEK